MDKIMVNLDDIYPRMSKQLAKLRNEENKKAGIKATYTDNDKAQLEMNTQAFCAEFAFGYWANLFVDCTIHPRVGGYDFKLHNGKTVDVKHTHHKTGYLSVNTSKSTKRTDIYVLVRGTAPLFEIAGWASAEEVFRDDNINLKGREPYHKIEAENLHNPIYLGQNLPDNFRSAKNDKP